MRILFLYNLHKAFRISLIMLNSSGNNSLCTETDEEDQNTTAQVLDSNFKTTKKSYNVLSDVKRQEIINALENGSVDRRSAAVLFNTNYHTVCRIYRMYCAGKICVKGKQGGKKPMKLLDEHYIYQENLR